MKIILYTDLMQSLIYEDKIRFRDFREGESEDEYADRINRADGFREAIAFIKESFGKGEPDVDWRQNYMKGGVSEIPTDNIATIPEILLQHGFVEVRGTYGKGGVVIYPIKESPAWSWFIDMIHLPGLTPDNLPTLLQILGVAKTEES